MLSVPSPRSLQVALVVVLALLLASCGGDEKQAREPSPKDEQAIRTVVTKFAEADDVDACELLTQQALERLYGGLSGCLEQASRFRGGVVTVEGVSFSPDADGARAQAISVNGERAFQVGLRKISGECGGVSGTAVGDWRISSVRETERPT